MTEIVSQTMKLSETLVGAVSFSGRLDSGELLTGTPTVVEQTTSDLTLSNKVVSTAALTINKINVPTAEAVQFKVVATVVGTYVILVTAASDATIAQTFIERITIVVEADDA